MASGVVKRDYSLRLDEKTFVYTFSGANYNGFKVKFSKSGFGYGTLIIKISHRYGYTIAIVATGANGDITHTSINNVIVNNHSLNDLTISNTSTSGSSQQEVTISGTDWNSFVIEAVLPNVPIAFNDITCTPILAS